MARLGFSLTTGLTSGSSSANPVTLPIVPVGGIPTSISNGTSRNDTLNVSNSGSSPTIIDARGGADQIALNPNAFDRVGYPFLSNVAAGINLNTAIAGVTVTQDVITGFLSNNGSGATSIAADTQRGDEILIDPRSFGFNISPDTAIAAAAVAPTGALPSGVPAVLVGPTAENYSFPNIANLFVSKQFIEVTNLLQVNSPASIAAQIGDQGNNIPTGNRTLLLTYAQGAAPGTVDAFINIHQSLNGNDIVEADEIIAGLIRIQNVGPAGSLTIGVQGPLVAVNPFPGAGVVVDATGFLSNPGNIPVGALGADIVLGNFALV